MATGKQVPRQLCAIGTKGSVLIEHQKKGAITAVMRSGKPKELGIVLTRGYQCYLKVWKRCNLLWVFAEGRAAKTLLKVELDDTQFDAFSKALGGREERDMPAPAFLKLLRRLP